MRRNQTTALALFVAAALALICAAAQAQSSKPNILVIWGDDIDITNISACSQGLMGCNTPNIEGWCR